MSARRERLSIDTQEGQEQLGRRGAREALCAAVAQLEAARGEARRLPPWQSLALSTALSSGRWSLVDHFESGGRRLLVAQCNEPRAPTIASLTARERAALGLARQRHSNKMVAYQMGISASTVGVLLHRAARKLGVSTRQELIAAYQAAEREPGT